MDLAFDDMQGTVEDLNSVAWVGSPVLQKDNSCINPSRSTNIYVDVIIVVSFSITEIFSLCQFATLILSFLN